MYPLQGQRRDREKGIGVGDRVDGMARKLYWRERRRVMGGDRSAHPVYPEATQGPDAGGPQKSGGTPVQVLERIPASLPESTEGVGWTTKDAELPEPSGDTQEDWPRFEKLAEITGQEEPGDSEGSTSAASIWRLARKMMAQEWRRALNKPMPDPAIIALEDSAVRIREEIDERKSRAALEEEEKQRADRQVRMLHEALKDIAGFYVRGGNEPGPAEFLETFIGAVRELGFVFEIRWDTDGCEIRLEPWEERRLRRMRRDDNPVVYHIGIDKDMEVVLRGIGQVDIPLHSTDNSRGGEEEDKDLFGVLAPGTRLLKLEDGEEPQIALRKRLSELGKAVGIEQDGDGWRAKLVPWGEVRARRLNVPQNSRNGQLVLELDQLMVITSCAWK